MKFRSYFFVLSTLFSYLLISPIAFANQPYFQHESYKKCSPEQILEFATNNEALLNTLLLEYQKILRQAKTPIEREQIKSTVLKSFELLSQSVNSSNWENQKIVLSKLLRFTENLFPEAKINQYFINLGDDLRGLPPEAIYDPKALKLKYTVSFTPIGLFELSTLANNKYKVNSLNSKALNLDYNSNSIGEILTKYVFNNPYFKDEIFFIIRAPKDIGNGVHDTLLVSKWDENGFLNIGIIDSLGYHSTPRPEIGKPFSNIYAEQIVNAAYDFEQRTGNSFQERVRIYVTEKQRQFDEISCPQFVLNDFYAFKERGFFNFINTVEQFKGQALPISSYLSINIGYGYIPNYSSITVVPEHPDLMKIAQTSSVIDLLNRDGLLNPLFVKNPAEYISELQNSFWPSKELNGKKVNARAQHDLYDLTHILLQKII